MPTRSRASTSRRFDSVQMAMANMPRKRWKQAVSHSRNACRTVSVSQCEWKLVSQLLELGANFEVVVNLAVEDDDGVAVGGLDRLVAAGYVENRQPGSAKGAEGGLMHTLLVWSAMDQRGRGFRDPLRTRQPIFMCKTYNPAHVF